MHYRIRFSAHLTSEHQEGLLSELADVYGATATQIAEGEFEINGFRPAKARDLLAQLQAEEAAGRLRLIEADD